MREAVLIVLNEREPTKAKVASELEESLKRQNITSSRLEIDQNLETVVLQRKAKIVVLDYLLGDYSTGLDILARLHSLPNSNRPKVFFLTDEPSVSVAVQALQGGATDYLEIDNPDAVRKITHSIAELLAQSPRREENVSRVLALEDCIAISKRSLEVKNKIKKISDSKDTVVVLRGGPGSGKKTLAQALALSRGDGVPYEVVDLRLFARPATELPGIEFSEAGKLVVATPHTLILTHAEEDNGEILSMFAEHKKVFESGNFFLTVCTDDEHTAKGWRELIDAPVIAIPDLKERADDISHLIQQFLRQAEQFSGKKVKPLEKETIAWLSQQKFPGNVSELRAAILNCALSDDPGKAEIEATLSEWEAEHNSNGMELDPLLAATVLNKTGQNYRIAAAYLGVRQETLRISLNQERRKS